MSESIQEYAHASIKRYRVMHRPTGGCATTGRAGLDARGIDAEICSQMLPGQCKDFGEDCEWIVVRL